MAPVQSELKQNKTLKSVILQNNETTAATRVGLKRAVLHQQYHTFQSSDIKWPLCWGSSIISVTSHQVSKATERGFQILCISLYRLFMSK